MTKPSQKRKTFTKNNFAQHNYNYVKRPKTTQPSRTNTQNQLFSQMHSFQQPSSNTVNFHDYSQISQEVYKNTRTNQKKYTSNYLSSDDDVYFQPDIFAPYTQEHNMRQPRPNPISQNINFLFHKI